MINATKAARIDVVPREPLATRMHRSTVGAGEAIPCKQLAICEAGHRIEQVHGAAASYGNDRVQVDDGLTAGARIHAATHGGQNLTNGPADTVSCVVGRGCLRPDPDTCMCPGCRVAELA